MSFHVQLDEDFNPPPMQQATRWEFISDVSIFVIAPANLLLDSIHQKQQKWTNANLQQPMLSTPTTNASSNY